MPLDTTAPLTTWIGTRLETETHRLETDLKTALTTGRGFVIPVFHGTTHNFTTFESRRFAHSEGQFGRVNCFTTSKHDAQTNYLEDGPDLKNRLESLEERWLADMVDGQNDDLVARFQADHPEIDVCDEDVFNAQNETLTTWVKEAARAKMVGTSPKVLNLWIRSDKPFVVNGKNGQAQVFADLSEEADQAVREALGLEADADLWDLDPDQEEEAMEIRDAIQAKTIDTLHAAFEKAADIVLERLAPDFVASRWTQTPDVPEDVISAIWEGDLTMNAFETALRNDDGIAFLDGPHGQNVASHFLAEVIFALGFDSIVLLNADSRFSNMGLEPGTHHIHIPDEKGGNIKRMDATLFDETSRDITQ